MLAIVDDGITPVNDNVIDNGRRLALRLAFISPMNLLFTRNLISS